MWFHSFVIFDSKIHNVKLCLQKYLSVFYLLLFVFQIAITYSSIVKTYSIESIQSLCGIQEHSNEDSERSQKLIDFESQEEDSEENKNGEDNEEQEEDAEDEFLKYLYRSVPVSNEFSKNYFNYFLKPSKERVKVEFAPPEKIV